MDKVILIGIKCKTTTYFTYKTKKFQASKRLKLRNNEKIEKNEEDTLWHDFKINYAPNYSLKINIIEILDQVLS